MLDESTLLSETVIDYVEGQISFKELLETIRSFDGLQNIAKEIERHGAYNTVNFAVKALKRRGFQVKSLGPSRPVYYVS